MMIYEEWENKAKITSGKSLQKLVKATFYNILTEYKAILKKSKSGLFKRP